MATAVDRHIALIGFMGAGKTTIGAMVATRIGRLFFDLDREIERSLQRSIPDLFEQEGEAEFRVIEAERTLGDSPPESARRARSRRRRGGDEGDSQGAEASMR